MPRAKKSLHSLKKRRTILKRAKGFRHGASKKERQAKERLLHAGVHAVAHRRDKKGDLRRLWNIKINAGLRPLGFSYSKFIHVLKTKKVDIDRKILADLAEHEPASFQRLVESLK